MTDLQEKKGFFHGRKGKQRIFIISMLAIPTLHFLVFWLWVNIDGLLLPFRNNVGGWVGLKNFEWVLKTFTGENKYLSLTEATVNTLIFFSWGLFVEMPISVVLAYTFYKNLPGNKFFTICLYLPSIITGTVMTTIFKNFLSADGPIALLYTAMGEQWVYPITQEGTAIPSMLAYDLWNGYGLSIILFHSSMKRIPKELFESAALDALALLLRQLAVAVLSPAVQ